MKSRLRALLFALALGSLLFGLSRGEPAAVMQKAVLLCLECIGFG